MARSIFLAFPPLLPRRFGPGLVLWLATLLLAACQPGTDGHDQTRLPDQAPGADLAPAASRPAASPALAAAPAGAARLGPDSPRIKDAPSRGLFWIDGPAEQVAELLLDQMGPDQLLAQVFLLGWPSEQAEGPVMDWISRRGLGGVKVFGWNGKNVATLASTLASMQRTALQGPLGIPLITATDQEGGWVRHIKDSTSSTPGNLAIGATGLGADAYFSSRYIAEELKAMGINMNFAPVVDIYTEADAHVIGPRSYGSDPEEVAFLSLAAYQGMEDLLVAATAKHFPGHGNAVGDSHGTMPVVQDDLETLWNRDLVPYRRLVESGLPAILVGHLSFPKIDPEGRPASLSRRLNHDLLRTRLGFQGVVMTDDIYMGGAWEFGEQHGWKLADIILESLRAGNDMVMLSRTTEPDGEVWNRLKTEYRDNPAFREAIRNSARRILRLKLRYLKPADRVPLAPSAQGARNGIPAAGSSTFFEQQAARAVSFVRGSALRPGDTAGKRVLLLGQDADFMHSAALFFPQARQFLYDYEPFYRADPAIKATIQALVRNSDLVIFCLANPNSQEILASLKDQAGKLTVLSTLTPVYLDSLPWVERAVAVFGWDRNCFRYGMAALTGQYEPGGHVPLRWFRTKAE